MVNFKNLRWFNNGEKNIRATECPEGFVEGKLKIAPPIPKEKIFIATLEDLDKCINNDIPQHSRVYFKCSCCGREKCTMIKQLNLHRDLMCPACRTRESKIKTFGSWDNYVTHRNEALNKSLIERYGTLNIFELEEFQEKRKATCRKKFGTDYALQSEEIKSKSRKTNLEKYGVEIASQNPNISNKRKSTILARYGVENYTETEDFKEKGKQKSLELYGVDHFSKVQEIKDKTKATCLERYGGQGLGAIEVANKIKQANIDNFGVDCPFKLDEVRSKAYANTELRKEGFRSSTEKKLAEMLKNRGLNFKPNYFLNGKYWDFAIFDNSQLKILLEIDGRYFHGLLNDFDGRHVVDGRDYERFLKVPEDVKLIVIDDNKLEDGINEIFAILNIDYETWIQDIISSLPKEFPYKHFEDSRMLSDYNKLVKYKHCWGQKLGYSLIQNFHPSIYSCRVGNKPSPLEAWDNKELLEKCVRNRFIYSSKLSSQSILNGFNVCKLAPKISVFNPSTAKYLVETYLPEAQTIFDPCSGYSGRMLGVCASGGYYIGQDINPVTINESENILSFLQLNAQLACKNLLEDSGEYEYLFTCPPYGNKENWGQNIKNKSCDEWIDEITDRYRCKKYMFVVDKTKKYTENIVKELTNKSHFGINKEYVIVINPQGKNI